MWMQRSYGWDKYWLLIEYGSIWCVKTNYQWQNLNSPDINGEWKVYNTYPQTGYPLDSTERYYLHPDYVHEYDDNDEVLSFLEN